MSTTRALSAPPSYGDNPVRAPYRARHRRRARLELARAVFVVASLGALFCGALLAGAVGMYGVPA